MKVSKKLQTDKVHYSNPKYDVSKSARTVKKKGRALVVLCSYIPEDNIAEYNSRSFKDHTYTQYQHNRLKCLKFTLSCYEHFEAGLPYDLIIVDNDSPSQSGKEYLESLDLPVYFRSNTYFSFGAYKYAWDKFGEDYDYFVFHEMDWVPSKDNWLKDLVNKWTSDKEIGMIGNLIETRGWTDNPQTDGEKINNKFISKINIDRKEQCNLDSEYLFTDKKVLEQMEQHDGWLIFPCAPETDLSPVFNELAFEQPILEMGYKIASYNDGQHTMFYGIYNRDFCDKWDHGLNDNLAPFIPEQTRLFIPEVREYFHWYKGVSSLVE